MYSMMLLPGSLHFSSLLVHLSWKMIPEFSWKLDFLELRIILASFHLPLIIRGLSRIGTIPFCKGWVATPHFTHRHCTFFSFLNPKSQRYWRGKKLKIKIAKSALTNDLLLEYGVSIHLTITYATQKGLCPFPVAGLHSGQGVTPSWRTHLHTLQEF